MSSNNKENNLKYFSYHFLDKKVTEIIFKSSPASRGSEWKLGYIHKVNIDTEVVTISVCVKIGKFFSQTVDFTYGIFGDLSLDTKDKIEDFKKLLVTLSMISSGTIRGMLFYTLAYTKASNFTLPPLPSYDIYKDNIKSIEQLIEKLTIKNSLRKKLTVKKKKKD